MNVINAVSFRSEVFSKLSENRNLYDPLVLIEIEKLIEPESSDLVNREADGVIRLSYIQQKLDMIFKIINRTAPQVVEKGKLLLKS